MKNIEHKVQIICTSLWNKVDWNKDIPSKVRELVTKGYSYEKIYRELKFGCICKEHKKKPNTIHKPLSKDLQRKKELEKKRTKYEKIAFSYIPKKYHAQYQRMIKGENYLYYADIYIPKYKVVIEVDGGYHETEEQKRKDRIRDVVMKSRGIKVYHIKNKDVCRDSITNIIKDSCTKTNRGHKKLNT